LLVLDKIEQKKAAFVIVLFLIQNIPDEGHYSFRKKWDLLFGRIFCTVFETVCASSLAMCAYQIGEHLHLTFADHLDLQSTIKSQFSVSVTAVVST
jgi:hypothetical protein